MREIVHRTACNRACSEGPVLCKWAKKPMLCKWPKEPVLCHIKNPNSLYRGTIELINILSLLSPLLYPWKYTISQWIVSELFFVQEQKNLGPFHKYLLKPIPGYINTMWPLQWSSYFLCKVLFGVHTLPSILWGKLHHSLYLQIPERHLTKWICTRNLEEENWPSRLSERREESILHREHSPRSLPVLVDGRAHLQNFITEANGNTLSKILLLFNSDVRGKG